MGSVTHEILEKLQQREIDNDKAIETFENAVTEADMLGYEWMSDSVKNKYIAAIKHYLDHYKPIECDEYFIEEYFEIPVGDKWMKGYIDLYTITDGVIDIYDYKTSSSSSFTEEVVEEVTKYVCDTVNKIESLDDNIESYEKGLNPNKDFFCKTLCGFRDRCLNK